MHGHNYIFISILHYIITLSLESLEVLSEELKREEDSAAVKVAALLGLS